VLIFDSLDLLSYLSGRFAAFAQAQSFLIQLTELLDDLSVLIADFCLPLKLDYLLVGFIVAEREGQRFDVSYFALLKWAEGMGWGENQTAGN